MKKLLPIICLVVMCITNNVYAQGSATACFESGYNMAAKALNAGDGSAFTPVYGPSVSSMQKSACCGYGKEKGESKGCMGFVSAFQYVQQHGATKTSLDYEEKLNLMRMMDTGMFGF